MTLADDTIRRFSPGTTGWSAEDLDIPKYEQLWENGHYEIVDGVLTKMPAACGDGCLTLNRLRRTIEDFLRLQGTMPDFLGEPDFVLASRRVVRPDLAYMTADDLHRQKLAQSGRRGLKIGRLVVPPTLIVESISRGHEAHDAQLKRTWYAEATVPNYWILDPFKKTLVCLVLEGDEYRTDCAGANADKINPAAFPGLVVDLSTLWV